ncbi:hypothetical protein [Streptomyces sp. NPDC088923]
MRVDEDRFPTPHVLAVDACRVLDVIGHEVGHALCGHSVYRARPCRS